jgi:MFS transporter, DHA2 family, multidrug resistance protein
MSTSALTPNRDTDQTYSAPAKPWRPRANPWAIALTVTLATFMEVLDTSIANVALPHIAGGLGASADEATWVLTSYLVANAVILPASSYLTTFIGRKKFYMICVVLFGLSSMLCGLAPSLPLLIFFRVLQGAGGGGLAPSEQSILADTFPPEKRGQAFALYGLAVVTAPAIGPTLGGWITDNYDWRWIFFINVPVALLSLFLTARLVEDPPWVDKEVAIAKVRGLNLDYFGFALLGIGFGSLEFVLDKGQEDDWFGSRIITFFIFACAIALVTLVFWELRQLRKGHRPILNLTLFKRKTFAISFLFMFILGFALYGTTVLIPQFVQSLLGYTAELAGFAMSPGGLMTMLMMPVVGFLIGKVDARYLMGFGFTIVGCALLAMHHMDLYSSYSSIALLRVFQASGLAFLFIPINTIAYTGVPQTQNNDVSGLTNLARNIGGSCGTAFVATMLTRRSQAHEETMIRNLTPSSQAFQERIHALSQIFVTHGLAPNITSAGSMAQAYIYQQMTRQAAMLAYLDIIAMLSIGCFLMLPMVLLVGKIKKPSGNAPMH